MSIIDELADRLPDDTNGEEVAGAALLGIGLIGTGIRVVRGGRGRLGWMLPMSLLLGGLYLLIDGALERRNSKMEAAEDVVREQLDDLDPIARAQVLKAIAQEQLQGIEAAGS